MCQSDLSDKQNVKSGRRREEVVPKQENCRWTRPTIEFGAILSVRKFREGRNASASDLFGRHRPKLSPEGARCAVSYMYMYSLFF